MANETFSNGNQMFVVVLEPGDIIVLNIPKILMKHLRLIHRETSDKVKS